MAYSVARTVGARSRRSRTARTPACSAPSLPLPSRPKTTLTTLTTTLPFLSAPWLRPKRDPCALLAGDALLSGEGGARSRAHLQRASEAGRRVEGGATRDGSQELLEVVLEVVLKEGGRETGDGAVSLELARGARRSRGTHDRARAVAVLDDVAVLVDEERVEVPADGVDALGALEELVDGVGVGPVDVRLLGEREGDAVVLLAKEGDLLVGSFAARGRAAGGTARSAESEGGGRGAAGRTDRAPGP